MSAVEKIQLAEEKVSDLQDQLNTVGVVLEKAETVAIAGEKTGRKARKLFKLLILAGVVAVVVIVIKKVMAKNRTDSIDVEFVDSTVTPPGTDASASDEGSDEDAASDSDEDEDSSDEASGDES